MGWEWHRRKLTDAELADSLSSQQLPPAANTFHGKFRGLMGDAHIDHGFVPCHIIGAIRDRFAHPDSENRGRSPLPLHPLVATADRDSRSVRSIPSSSYPH